MDKVQLIQRLMTTFLEEMDEHVRAFNRDLLALEKAGDADERAVCFKTLLRTAHSLKGASRSVNVSLLEGACHRLEEVLERLRDGKMDLDPDLFRLLFATVDGVEEVGMRLREQQDVADSPLAALLPRLDAAVLPIAGPLLPKTPVVPIATATPVVPKVPPEATKPVPERPAHEPHLTADAASVRVSAEKLDSLLARIGELLVARRRVQARSSELVLLEEFVEHWEHEWRGVEKLVDRMCGDEKTTGRANGKLDMSRRIALILRQNGTRLRRLKKKLEHLNVSMKGDNRLLDQVIAPLDDEVHSVRMLPFAEACAGLDRLVRDLAQSGGKEVELAVEGGAVELDRSILEGLKDPLRHLVRNAVDHGIEPPDQRQQAGKLRLGRITVAAALRGSQVDVFVQDDGRGIDLEALRDQARRRNLTEPADERELAQMIFLPGVSTAVLITDVSGRGVGLDVVKSQVQALHGNVELSFVAGKGTCFTLVMPLTLTTLRAALVTAGGQTFAVAGTSVHRFVRAGLEDLRTVAGRETLALGGQPLPFAHLLAVLQPNVSLEQPTSGKFPVLVVAAGDKRVAFAVDEFLAEQEILIKSLGSRIRQVPLVAGATLLSSGKIALVLNGANLVRAALGRTFAPRTARPTGSAQAARKRLLIVEDSVTTRTLEKSILEAAGYEVAAAVDGLAAWEFLKDHDVDLIVSDVEMPNMDGFELAQTVRSSAKLRSVPLVLVTARETDQDKARGIEVGADAYLVKSAFDQRNLLETIAQLL